VEGSGSLARNFEGSKVFTPVFVRDDGIAGNPFLQASDICGGDFPRSHAIFELPSSSK
jgi:hypothetical protein